MAAERGEFVAIVGAGLIGSSIAYELAKRGVEVTVFDRAEPARAASWAGAGMLAPFSEAMPDAAMLALCRDSLACYPAYVEELRSRTGVDARLRRDGTVHIALSDERMSELRALASVFAANGGDVEVFDAPTLRAREPMVASDARGALFVANEAQVDNRRLGRAIVAAASALGVHFETVGEIAIEADDRRVRGLRTERGFVAARIVVNAAGAWAGMLEGVPPFAQLPVRPVAGEMLALAVPRTLGRALVWHGHTYLVPRDDGRLLVGATVLERGFDARVTAGGIATLLAQALAAAPMLADFAVVETWSGLRPGSADGRPYLGATALEGYVAAAGHYRNGILLTPLTAQLIAAQICGEDVPRLNAFDPARCAPEADFAIAKMAAV